MSANGNQTQTINQDGSAVIPPKLHRHSLPGLRDAYGDVYDGLMNGSLGPKTGQEANRALAGSLNTFRVELDAMQKANLGEAKIRQFTTKLLGLADDEPKKLQQESKSAA